VDDASSDGTSDLISSRFPDVILVRNNVEKLVAESRNIGIRASKGDYVFLIDDDNVLDRKCIENLYLCMVKDHSIGMVMPIIYFLQHPEWRGWAGVRRNMITSFTYIIRRSDEGNGELNDTEDCPNAFMCSKAALQKNGLFNSTDYPIHYEEADLGIRMKRAGFKAVCNPSAKTFHDHEGKANKLAGRTVHTPMRAYYTGRNRIVFHSTYSKPWEFALFTLIFYPIVVIFYSYLIIRYSKSWSQRQNLLFSYLKGNLDGWKAII
jgi:GT2 family glycosyltransferase